MEGEIEGERGERGESGWREKERGVIESRSLRRSDIDR